MKKEIFPYDKTKVYQEQIEPLVEQLKIACAINDVPFFMEFAIKNDERSTTYKYEAYSANAMGKPLTKDHFEKHLLLAKAPEHFQVKITHNDELKEN